MSNLIQQAVIDYLKVVLKPEDVAIGVKASGTPGVWTPCIIRNKEKLNELKTGFFHLNTSATYLSEFFLRENKLLTSTIGKLFIICKPCDTPGINQILSDQQIKADRIQIVVYACEGLADMKKISTEVGMGKDIKEAELQQGCLFITLLDGSLQSIAREDILHQKCRSCSGLDSIKLPHVFIGDEKQWKNTVNAFYAEPKALLQDQKRGGELLEQIKAELSECIRCNACRNICHACFCSDRCIFDKPKMTTGFLDKEFSTANNLIYHMIRFYHVAPNCTACGECERVCPQGIPLSHLYQYVNRVMQSSFDQLPGSSDSIRQSLLSYRLGEDLV